MSITSEVLCLATAIFFEARDQGITGQEAVADVVMNRVEHGRFPDNVCNVVYQPYAFSFTHDGKSDDMNDYQTHFDKIAQEDAIKLAERYVEDGYRLGISSTHYHAFYVDPFWADVFELDGFIRDHVFYTCTGFC